MVVCDTHYPNDNCQYVLLLKLLEMLEYLPMKMIWDFVFGKDLASFQTLSQLCNNLIRVLLVRGVDHGVSAAPHDHIHHRLHGGQRVADRDLVDGEPRNGKLVRMVSRLRGHSIRHSVV